MTSVGNFIALAASGLPFVVDFILHFGDIKEITQKGPTHLEDRQSQSYITMNLDEDYKDSTVVHEFGHALGFQHSHLVPSFPGIWNVDKAYAHWGDPEGQDWDKDKIDHNVLRTVEDLPETESFDPESIMMYDIPNNVLTNYKIGFPDTNTMSAGDIRALKNVYEERAPEDDYLFILGTANYSTVGKNIVNKGFTCRNASNSVNIFVRQQDDVYKRAKLNSEVCDGITEAVVYIESRGIVSRGGVDHLEMKAEVEYYSNSVTAPAFRILEDEEEKVFTLPIDGQEHEFKLPRVYASKRWVPNPLYIPFITPLAIEVGGSYTDVTLKLQAAHLLSIDGLEVLFPHRRIVPSAPAPAIALTNGPVDPEETALLTNYPNPFNPETWIPYQLAKPSDVTLSIHGVDGKLVRTLALGHQAAGVYHSKARAAYWDGRNEFGERVASGLYFYTLTAGDFSATSKMLIMK